ncbi:hypothetical protein CI102_2134 [Trichoderma harzianum]|nr:hypothetical protein CI102_2134 [Trichoderma harzianum]
MSSCDATLPRNHSQPPEVPESNARPVRDDMTTKAALRSPRSVNPSIGTISSRPPQTALPVSAGEKQLSFFVCAGIIGPTLVLPPQSRGCNPRSADATVFGSNFPAML